MQQTTVKTLRGLNRGERAEKAVYDYYGQQYERTNTAYTRDGDITINGIAYQVKSGGASISIGKTAETLDFQGLLDRYIKTSAAKRYIYVTDDLVGYILTKTVFKRFVESFGYYTHDSAKNGGRAKIRLRRDSKRMREWLENHSRTQNLHIHAPRPCARD